MINFEVEKYGASGPYKAYNANDVIKTIQKKLNKNYSDIKSRILILDASCCAPFSWEDYWNPVEDFAKQTQFAAIFAINPRNKTQILALKQFDVL